MACARTGDGILGYAQRKARQAPAGKLNRTMYERFYNFKAKPFRLSPDLARLSVRLPA